MNRRERETRPRNVVGLTQTLQRYGRLYGVGKRTIPKDNVGDASNR
jgi:hypothetical protein